jgi:hypothetical protein
MFSGFDLFRFFSPSLDCFLPMIDQAALVSLPTEVAHIVHSRSSIWLACMYYYGLKAFKNCEIRVFIVKNMPRFLLFTIQQITLNLIFF